MRSVRIVVWHGWLLEGSGSNVATARIVEVWRAAGHDVLLLCQERHPERYRWIDAHGTIDRDGPSELEPNTDVASAPGRCVLLRPDIGATLPVFVVDHYEGFETVRSFVDLSDEELGSYLRTNVEALRAAAGFHDAEIAFVGHGIPGAAIGGRALGPGRYVAKIHGSDLEYAIRPQERYRELAREGLEAAHAVVGPSIEALERCAELVPEMRDLARVVPPGVDVAAFRPRPRVEALREVAARLDDDPGKATGRPSSLDAEVERALDARDAKALDALFDRYDEDVPEPDAPSRLRTLAREDGPIVGYLGKLIPQKGAELLLEAQPALRHETAALVVGFGSDRDWLAALTIALRRGDRAALEWLRDAGGLPVDPRRHLGPSAVASTSPSPGCSTTGTRRARCRPWTCRWSPRSSRRRSGWSPRRALPPAPSRWSPGIRASRRSPTHWRPTSVVPGCSPSSRARAPCDDWSRASTDCCRCRRASEMSSGEA